MENDKILEGLRKEIDECDRRLVGLFISRMETAGKIADYKRENHLPVLDAERERALLARISELAGDGYSDAARVLYSTILSLSRAHQQKLLGGASETVEIISSALEKTPKILPESAAVACQGVEGAYSQLAAARLFGLPQISYFRSFDDVFAAIESGSCRYGVLPIENSTAGSVSKIYDLIRRRRFYIVRSVRLKVDHCLLAARGADVGGIKEIFSHEQAIEQCAGFLRGFSGVKVTVCANTAAADLENIKAAGKLVVGMECAYAPYNWAQASANGDYTVALSNGSFADGYDVQIAKKIAEALGVELVIAPTTWDGLISSLESGGIDMIIAGMSPTEERKLNIDFSDTYFDSNLVMVVKKDSQYASATKISDFSGAKITGQLNTFHYNVIDQISGVSKQTALEDFAALMLALQNGAIDGYVCEKPGAISAVASNPDFAYVEFAEGDGFTCDPAESSIAVGVRKGSSLTAEINKVIASLSTSDKEALMDGAIERQPKA